MLIGAIKGAIKKNPAKMHKFLKDKVMTFILQKQLTIQNLKRLMYSFKQT